jgi:hypothetical protein
MFLPEEYQLLDDWLHSGYSATLNLSDLIRVLHDIFKRKEDLLDENYQDEEKSMEYHKICNMFKEIIEIAKKYEK